MISSPSHLATSQSSRHWPTDLGLAAGLPSIMRWRRVSSSSCFLHSRLDQWERYSQTRWCRQQMRKSGPRSHTWAADGGDAWVWPWIWISAEFKYCCHSRAYVHLQLFAARVLLAIISPKPFYWIQSLPSLICVSSCQIRQRLCHGEQFVQGCLPNQLGDPIGILPPKAKPQLLMTT